MASDRAWNRRLEQTARPSLKALLLAPEPRQDDLVPPRGRHRRRAAPTLDWPVYLLDANVVSELRRHKPHGAIVAWFGGVSEDAIFLSAGSLGEPRAGVELTRRQDPGKAQAIEAWLDLVAQSDNILPMDGRAFRQWAKLLHGRSDTLIEDAMIAATAILHGLTVFTRNVRNFRVFGVAVLDPFPTCS